MSLKHIYTLFFLFSLLSAQVVFADSSSWTSCYDKKTNKVYFNSLGKDSKSCKSNTFYKAPKSYHLITNLPSKDAFAAPRPGTKRAITLDSGRTLLVSQWNNLSKANTIVVLEPNLKNKTVKKHCALSNLDEAFSVRFDENSGKLMVQVRDIKDLVKQTYHRVWRPCKI